MSFVSLRSRSLVPKQNFIWDHKNIKSNKYGATYQSIVMRFKVHADWMNKKSQLQLIYNTLYTDLTKINKF